MASWVMSDVTRILADLDEGDPRAAERLLPLVYGELRRLAAARLAGEKPGQTLQATALVHEAYLRLVEDGAARSWNSRGHFFAAAAEAMRRILVESARHKLSLKAGGGQPHQRLTGVDVAVPPRDDDLLALHEALVRFEGEHPRKASLVKLRYFAGLTQAEAAAALGISTSTADNDWAFARSWLKVALADDPVVR